MALRSVRARWSQHCIFRLHPHSRQAGVTLLLAVMVLAAILAISFSLATILFVEVRSSGDVYRSEPAIYAAQAVTEESFFQSRRGIAATSFPFTSAVNAVKVAAPVQTSYGDPIVLDKVVPLSSGTASPSLLGLRNRYVLCDAGNCYSTGSGYGSLQVTFINNGSGGRIYVFVCQFAPGSTSVDCDTKNGTDLIYNSNNGTAYLTPGASSPVIGSGYGFDPAKQQELIIYGDNTTNDMYVEISTLDSSGNPKGLPYFGKYAVDISAANASVFRKVRTIIPTAAYSGNGDTVWVEDALPAGASPSADGSDSWNWVGTSPNPFSGSLSHQSNIGAGEHQHYFSGANPPLVVNPGDVMVAYVYLDPANPPSEIELQWNTNSCGWCTRAFWNNTGTDQIGWGTVGTNSLRYIGPLPATGTWVRLEVPASTLGLEGQSINGMAFTLFGGRAAWDHAGKKP